MTHKEHSLLLLIYYFIYNLITYLTAIATYYLQRVSSEPYYNSI
jgi:hypothetical protein